MPAWPMPVGQGFGNSPPTYNRTCITMNPDTQLHDASAFDRRSRWAKRAATRQQILHHDHFPVPFRGSFVWLLWMFLHLMLILTVRNKLIVFIDWSRAYTTKNTALRIKIRKQMINGQLVIHGIVHADFRVFLASVTRKKAGN